MRDLRKNQEKKVLLRPGGKGRGVRVLREQTSGDESVVSGDRDMSLVPCKSRYRGDMIFVCFCVRCNRCRIWRKYSVPRGSKT